MGGIGPGDRFQHLEVEREIGRGAFGRVYLARDTLLGRPVALKVFRATADVSAAERERILAEARLIGRMQSPHVVTLYRIHEHPEAGLLFEMEYLEGGSLEDVLEADALPPLERRLALARAIASGLRDAHAEGIVHGDVKPRNVLLNHAGTAKLADFGLAHLVEDPGLRTSTSGGPVGTPRFMAPEVLMGNRPTVAADLWGFGILLYQLVGRAHPFPGTDFNTVFQAIQNAEPAPLPPDVPPEAAALAFHCLEKDPRARPESCEEVLERLAPGGPGTTVAVAAAPRADRRAGIHGRDAELARFRERLDRAAAGDGQAVVVTGDAGIGKSSLLRRVGSLARARGFQCVEVGVSPVEGLMRPLLLGLRAPFGPGALDERFGSSGSVLARMLHDEETAVESREQLAWAIERLVVELTRDAPLALLIDDGGHAGIEDMRLLSDLGRHLRAARTLLAVGFRVHDPDESTGRRTVARYHALTARPEFEHVELTALPAEAVLQVIRDEQGDRRVPREVARRIVALAEGNPLYAKQLLRHLIEADLLEAGESAWVPRPGWAEHPLPRRIRDLVRQRLDGLTEEQRSMLDVAALDGLSFDGEAVAAVLGQPLLLVLRVLQSLYRERGIVVAHGPHYRFAHALIHEAIHDDTAPALRRLVHRKLAEHLEARVADGAEVDPERLGLHWERAGEHARARPYLLRAACRAEMRQESERTIDLCRRAGLVPGAIEAGGARDDRDALVALAVSLSDAGRRDEALSVLDTLIEAAGRAGDETMRLGCVARRARLTVLAGGLDDDERAAVEHAADELPDGREKGAAHYSLGIAAKYRRDVAEAEARFREADRVFRAIGFDGGHSDALDQLGALARIRGDLEEAERLHGEAARASLRIGRRANAAISEVNRCLAAFGLGRFDGLAPRLERSIRSLELCGPRATAAHATLVLAYVRFAEGDLARAAAHVSRALSMLPGEEHFAALTTALLTSAEIDLAQGRLRRARESLERARTLAEAKRHANVHVNALAHAAQLEAIAGAPERALAASREAIRIAREAGTLGGRSELSSHLAEAVVYGAPAEAVRELLAGSDRLPDLGRGLLEAALCLAADTRETAPLRAVATMLEEHPPGERRAVLRLLGSLCGAAADHRDGRRTQALAGAREALQRARAFGHVPLQIRLCELIAGIAGDDDARAEAEQLRRRMD